MEEGIKYDVKKLDWLQLPFRELEDVVRVLNYGAEKYSADNWKRVKPKDRYIKATLRHLTTYIQGERLDSETNESHLAHAVASLLFLMWHDNEEEVEK